MGVVRFCDRMEPEDGGLRNLKDLVGLCLSTCVSPTAKKGTVPGQHCYKRKAAFFLGHVYI